MRLRKNKQRGKKELELNTATVKKNYGISCVNYTQFTHTVLPSVRINELSSTVPLRPTKCLETADNRDIYLVEA